MTEYFHLVLGLIGKSSCLLIDQEVFKDGLSKMLNALHSYISVRGCMDLCASVARMELAVDKTSER